MDFLEKVKKMEIPVLLLINKIDTPFATPEGQKPKSPTEALGELVEKWHTLLPNAEILPISAKNKFGVDLLLKRIKELLPESPAYFDKEQLTDKPARFFVSEIIREKILLYYQKEIPYSCEVAVESYEEKDGIDSISCLIFVERESQKAILIGHQGKAIKKLGIEARKDIEEFTGKRCFLSLHIKVLKDWRNNELQMKRFGYSLGD
jgi:GTP-binding protein Era